MGSRTRSTRIVSIASPFQLAQPGIEADSGPPGYLVEYVNAQFRFVMKPSGNYTAHFADPDL